MSLIKHIRRDKSSNYNFKTKETRWDRIRKKSHNNNSNHLVSTLKSDAIRRFLEIDFIGKYQEKLLNGEQNADTSLNPQLVMDIRHEMFRRKSKKGNASVIVRNRYNQNKCIAHNIDAEERYINNKLNTFRTQLEKRQKINEIKTRKIEEILKSDSPRLQNQKFIEGLEETSKAMNGFYMVPIEALIANDKLCQSQNSENKKTNSIINTNKIKIQIPLSEEILKAEKVNNQDCKQMFSNENDGIDIYDDDNKNSFNEFKNHEADYVKRKSEEDKICHHQCFENPDQVEKAVSSIELFSYQRAPTRDSICSDEYNSVISDLAEEMLTKLELDNKEEIETRREAEEEEINDKYQPNCIELSNNKTNLNKENTNELISENFLIVTPLEQSSLIMKNESRNSLLQNNSAHDSPISSCEQNLIVEELFQTDPCKNITIMRKFFRKWIHYTTMTRIENQSFISKHDRISKINSFLDKLRREKVRLNKSQTKLKPCDQDRESCKNQEILKNTNLTKKYENKIKLQEDIIDLQRLKLERQQRMILELKLNKLSNDAKEEREVIKNELKDIIRSGNPITKAKAKCLQAVGNLKEKDDGKLTLLQGHTLPTFLQNMHERALERSIKHEQARQRRLQHEAEREAERMAAEEAKRLEDEQAKRKRIEELKEKRRQEKCQKVIRERERQRAIENRTKSEEFYNRLLLRRIGMEGFRRLVKLNRERLKECLMLQKKIIQKNVFLAWRNYWMLANEEKTTRADNFFHDKLKRKSLDTWKNYIKNERSKFYVAIDWYDLKLTNTTFIRWFGYSKHQKMIEDTKLYQAAQHHQWHLKWKVLDCWRRLPQILQLEKETEERRQRWRMKIWELLPDYTPNRDEEI